MKFMKYLSLFSGIGAGEQAIKELNLDWECAGYSEIDKYALQIYRKHFPGHHNFGDITEINIKKLPDFDLLFGGSPCQDLSIAKKKRKGLDGSRSNLFYNFVEILKIKKPTYFLLENVASMPKKDKQIITDILGVKPVMINADLVSAQQRKRLFWCNWKVEQPENKYIYIKDILEKNVDSKYLISDKHLNSMKKCNKNFKTRNINGKTTAITATYYKIPCDGNYILVDYNIPKIIKQIGKKGQGNKIYKINGKFVCLFKDYVRKLTPIECERLQCFPKDFTKFGIDTVKGLVKISDTQRFKCLGNAFNVEVIKHILNQMNNNSF